MIKYILNNNEIYVDFDYIQKSINRSRSWTFKLLKDYLKNNEVKTVKYKNLEIYEEKAISGLLNSLPKK